MYQSVKNLHNYFLFAVAESMIKAESLCLTLTSIPKCRQTSLAVAVENVATATQVLLSMWPQAKMKIWESMFPT